MTATSDGGPAFPVPHFSPGMTLHQYFAAAALQGMLADPEISGTHQDYANEAIYHADAMIEAYQRREGEKC